MVTLATREPAAPYAVRAAEAHAPAPPADDWMLLLGAGDELQRGTFHVFERDAPLPARVVKFARHPEAAAAFDADEHGLTLAARAGPRTAAHAPALLARFDLDGAPASVEQAATGRPLDAWLLSRGRGRREIVDSVARWILDVARETDGGAATLDATRAALRTDPHTAEAAARLPAVPGVLAHHDLGTWNVVTDGRSFVVLDWEAARRPALPLGDLLYFLADACTLPDGAAPSRERVGRMLALFRGEHRESGRVFAHVRAYVAALALPPEAVGPLATLCWSRHARSHVARAAALGAAGDDLAPASLGPLALLADPWLADPVLGTGWHRWR
jgi:hypothetical protein